MLERLKHLAFSTEFNSQTAGCRAARKCWFMMRIKERWSPWSCFILQSHDISDTLKMNSHFKDEFAPLPLECSHTLDRFADRGGFILVLFPPDPYLIRSEFSFFFWCKCIILSVMHFLSAMSQNQSNYPMASPFIPLLDSLSTTNNQSEADISIFCSRQWPSTETPLKEGAWLQLSCCCHPLAWVRNKWETTNSHREGTFRLLCWWLKCSRLLVSQNAHTTNLTLLTCKVYCATNMGNHFEQNRILVKIWWLWKLNVSGVLSSSSLGFIWTCAVPCALIVG